VTVSSVFFKFFCLLLLGVLFWVALGLWHRAPPPPSSASLWLSGPEAAILIQNLGKRPSKADGAPENTGLFLPPVRGEAPVLWDGLGLLYSVDSLQPVYAPAAGEVLFARFVPDVGYVLMIRHDQQRISVITGLAKPSFHEGDLVKTNQILGVPEKDKDTLFYMLRQKGKVVDPRKMFDTVGSPL
jgi:hypothetical protein